MYQQSRGHRYSRPDPRVDSPGSTSGGRPRVRPSCALRVNGRLLTVDVLPVVTSVREREQWDRSPGGDKQDGAAHVRRRRRHVILAYGALALAAGLFAAVCATDGELPAVLAERMHGGRAKGALRVAAEKRAASERDAARGSGGVRRPRGLPWLEERWRE